MDEVDIRLIKFLLMNSRRSYRELADELGLSINAVHKRVQVLIELGIIRTFTAKVSLSVFRGITILVFGLSDSRLVDEVCKKLGDNDSTYWVSVAGGNYLYIGANLQNISELESYVAYVKKEAQMSDPTVGIFHQEPLPQLGDTTPPRDKTLHPLDYQIIYALHKNSRKPVSEVGEELRVSAKTIRRRLSRMISEGLIELSLEWYPDKSNDVMTIFHLSLRSSVDKSEVTRLL
ncbi:MAG: AsnC family transcriptional regulator, partial [Nitrososphaerales archaeon]